MQMRFPHPLLLLFCLLAFSACRPTRCLKEGEYMLKKNVVKVTDRKGEEFSDLQYLVRPTPNKKFMDVFPIKTSIYANHQPKYDPVADTIVKDSRFNRWMRSRGEAPVLLDTERVSYSMEQLKIAMNKMGYFQAKVSSEVKYEKKKATVYYSVVANEPYFIDKLDYVVEIPEYKRLVLDDTAFSLLRVGMQYNADSLLAEKDRIITTIRDEGYYYVPNNMVYFVVDTMRVDSLSRKKRVGIEIYVNLSRVTNPVTLQKYNCKYEYNNVYVYSDYNPLNVTGTPMDTVRFLRGKNDNTRYYFITPKSSGKTKKDGRYVPYRDYRYRTLTDLMFTKRGENYTQTAATRSHKRLNDLKNFNYINIEYQDMGLQDSLLRIGYLNTVYKLSRSKVHALAAEVDVRSDKANLSLTYSNRNIFKGAETFNFNVYGGLDILFRTRESGRWVMYTENSEVGGELSIDFPRLLLFRKTQKIESLRYSTSVKLGAHWQRSSLYERLILNTGIAYAWTPNVKYAHSITPIDFSIVNIQKFEGFDEVIKNYSLAFQEKYKENVLLSFRYVFNYTPPVKSGRNALTLRLKFESSGMVITGVNALFKMPKAADGTWKFCGMNYANYELVDLDLRYSHTINAKNKVAMRLNFGVGVPLFNSSVLPFEKSFYLGGANSMRAWQFRTLGPGSYYTEGTRAERSGDVKLEMNVEYRGTIYKFIKYGVFVDAGNIWLMKKDSNMENAEFRLNRFYKEIALAAGVGIRLDFNFFILRVDLALPLYDPNDAPGSRWMTKDDWKKLYIPFAIGYAF